MVKPFSTQGEVEAYMAAFRRLREQAAGRSPIQRASLLVDAVRMLKDAGVPLKKEVLDAVLDKAFGEAEELTPAEEAGIAVRAAMEAGLIPSEDVAAMKPAVVSAIYAEIVNAFAEAYKDPKS